MNQVGKRFCEHDHPFPIALREGQRFRLAGWSAVLWRWRLWLWWSEHIVRLRWWPRLVVKKARSNAGFFLSALEAR